ncbi:MAG: division/cell wall cluster transcriptional repressor MraZ [Candidatus Omnitrophota bacterium]
MFYGEYTHGIDNKGRLILPSRFREVSKENGIERFFVTRGLDRCIFMFADQQWRQEEQRFKNLSFTKQEARQFNRLFFSGAVEVVPDKQGRFILPEYLKDFAGIKKDAVVIGVSNRIEIWQTQSWQEFYTKTSGEFEKTAENMLNLD